MANQQGGWLEGDSAKGKTDRDEPVDKNDIAERYPGGSTLLGIKQQELWGDFTSKKLSYSKNTAKDGV